MEGNPAGLSGVSPEVITQTYIEGFGGYSADALSSPFLEASSTINLTDFDLSGSTSHANAATPGGDATAAIYDAGVIDGGGWVTLTNATFNDMIVSTTANSAPGNGFAFAELGDDASGFDVEDELQIHNGTFVNNDFISMATSGTSTSGDTAAYAHAIFDVDGNVVISDSTIDDNDMVVKAEITIDDNDPDVGQVARAEIRDAAIIDAEGRVDLDPVIIINNDFDVTASSAAGDAVAISMSGMIEAGDNSAWADVTINKNTLDVVANSTSPTEGTATAEISGSSIYVQGDLTIATGSISENKISIDADAVDGAAFAGTMGGSFVEVDGDFVLTQVDMTDNDTVVTANSENYGADADYDGSALIEVGGDLDDQRRPWSGSSRPES